MANTLLNAVKNLRNDSLREIVSVSAFTGETLAAVSPFLGSNYGYTSGGSISGGSQNVIEKFSFTSDANATDVGNLTVGRYGPSGQSSTTHGYTSGGFITTNIIDKFSFAADGNATDVGDLTAGRYMYSAGTSSTASGYATGPSLLVDKFPFSSDANATDVLNLTATRIFAAGQQI